jgi:cephalosporin hydroxylase
MRFESLIRAIDNYFPGYSQNIKKSKWTKFKWRGLTLMKDPMTTTIYQQLIQDIKPKTIIEFGSFEGGSAQWMSDLNKSIENDCTIYTFDIDISQIRCYNKDIVVTQLDVNHIRQYVNDNMDMLKQLPRPVVVIEDCHVNVTEICTEVDKFLKVGDYLIVEDTVDYKKYNELSSFMLSTNNYEVDRYYCDFWGFNNSWNMNSFLKKIK